MTPWRFWIPVAVFFGVTPFMWFLGLMSAGAGHGDYFLAKILFPYSLLSTTTTLHFTNSLFVLAIIQYPVYGVLMGIANLYRKLLICGVTLAVVHIGCVTAAFAFADPYFSGRFR